MKKKILIQVTEYFSAASWEKAFEKTYPHFNSNFEICYFDKINKFNKLAIECECGFIVHLDHGMSIKNSKMKFIYLGVSDIDYMDDYNFPSHITIKTSKGLAKDLIAEYTVMVALSLTRNYHASVLNKSKKKWDQIPFLKQPALPLNDYKIGILGLGENGAAIAKMFKLFGCYVTGLSRTAKYDLKIDSWFNTDQLDQILKLSDIIIISLPLRSDTKHLIGIKQFKAMGKNSYLINISRGDVLDEPSLIYALEKQLIKAAAIDVCSIEPLPKRSKLWKLPNLIISPHIAGNINLITDKIQKDFILQLKNLTK